MLREAKGLIQSRKNILGIKRRLTDSTDCWHWQIWAAQTRPFLRAHMQDAVSCKTGQLEGKGMPRCIAYRFVPF